MEVPEKIRLLRETKHWTQEEMAGRLDMSVNSYARMERGESKLDFEKLERIADVFDIDVLELVNPNSRGVVLFVGENTMPNNYGSLVYNHNYYGAEEMAAEADRLRLMLGHKDEIIAQKDKELAALQEIIALLKARQD